MDNALQTKTTGGVNANIVLISLATILVSVSLGINSILIPVSLSNMGYTEAFVGGILAFDTIAAVAIALALSFVLARFDIKRLLIWTTIFRVLPLFLLLLTDNIVVWSSVIFIHGLALAMFYIGTQTWVNALPLDKNRGLIIGLYNTAYAIGLAAGPIIIQFKEQLEAARIQHFGEITELTSLTSRSILGETPGMETALLLSIALTAIGTIPVLFLRKNFPRRTRTKQATIGQVIKSAPDSMLAVCVAGVSSAGVLAFIAIYGQKNALTMNEAALLLTSFVLGSLTLQTLFSWLSDVFDRRNTLVVAAFISMCCAAALPMAIYYIIPALVLVYLWGGAIGGIYSITLAMLGDEFADNDLSTANAGYELMDNAGGLAGVVIIGFFMTAFGSDGLPYVIMFASILYFSFALTRFKVI